MMFLVNNFSQRQFFTVPGNDVPNDRDTFMKWCYRAPASCKEGNGLQCAANQLGCYGKGRKRIN